MSRYGLAGRALRSPLNPVWSLAQAPRFAGNAMASATPAAAALGDQFVDKVAPQLSEMAGGLAEDILGKGKYTDQLRGLAADAAPMAAKLGGRLAWGGAAGMMGGLGDIGAGESPTHSLNNVMRGQMMAGFPTSGGSQQMPRVGADADEDDPSGGPFNRAPSMEMGPPVPDDMDARHRTFMTGGVANVTGGPQAGMMGGMGMPLPPPGNPATDNWDIGHWHPAVPQRRRQPGLKGTNHQPSGGDAEGGFINPWYEPGTMSPQPPRRR